MPEKSYDLKDVIQIIDGKVRVDLKKILEIDSDVKGLPRKVAGGSGIQFSRGPRSTEFNEILEQATKVEAEKTFSDTQRVCTGVCSRFHGINI